MSDANRLLKQSGNILDLLETFEVTQLTEQRGDEGLTER